MILESYHLLKRMEGRPAMWTGELSLKSIHCYISGYYQALLDHQLASKDHSEEPFFDWVANKLGYYESTAGWANMILAASMGFQPGEIDWEAFLTTPVTYEQHLQSIRYFYELVEDYKKESTGEHA